jgi:hypothetical protein
VRELSHLVQGRFPDGPGERLLRLRRGRRRVGRAKRLLEAAKRLAQLELAEGVAEL